MIAGVALILLVTGLGAAWLIANSAYRQHQAEVETAWNEIAANAASATSFYEPAMVADLPEIAQRYFNHAIAPGTPLSTIVELEMDGRFLLGDRDKFQTYEMSARQILSAPSEFIWRVELRSGPIVVTGSDGLRGTHAWMRMWMFWSIPLVQVAATEGLDRSALTRPALEAIWAPASLLPAYGARWEQLSSDKARVTLGKGTTQTVVSMTIAESGRVIDIVADRWSDANPQKVFQLQPLGACCVNPWL